MVRLFFQAEDGIRDYKVTGVQTCALPISAGLGLGGLVGALGAMSLHGRRLAVALGVALVFWGLPIALIAPHPSLPAEIGRASCREKSVDLGGRRIIKKKKDTASRRCGAKS